MRTVNRSTAVLWTTAALALSLAMPPAAHAADDVRLVIHRGDDVNAMLTRLVGSGGVAKVLEHNGLSPGAVPAPGQEIVVPGRFLVDLSRSTAELLYTRGTVTAQAAGGSILPAGVGARLQAGDRLTTGSDGSASVRLVGVGESLEHDHLFVDPGTELEISQILVAEKGGWRSALVKLARGAVEVVTSGSAENKKQVEVETPTAIGGVRGTEFRVTVEPAFGDTPVSTRVETLDGNVMTAASGAEVTVGAGFGSRIEEGQPPGAPRPLPLAPVPTLPADGGTLDGFEFRWEPVDGAVAYVMEIALDDEFLLIDQKAETTQPFHAPPTATLPIRDEPLHWRVSAIDGEGFRGPASPPRSFVLP